MYSQILLPALLLHGSFDFVLFLLGAVSFVYPEKEHLCNTLTYVFVIFLTSGGILTAVVMFNKVVRDYEMLTAQENMVDNTVGEEDHHGTQNPISAHNNL